MVEVYRPVKVTPERPACCSAAVTSSKPDDGLDVTLSEITIWSGCTERGRVAVIVIEPGSDCISCVPNRKRTVREQAVGAEGDVAVVSDRIIPGVRPAALVNC